MRVTVSSLSKPPSGKSEEQESPCVSESADALSSCRRAGGVWYIVAICRRVEEGGGEDRLLIG